MRLKILLLMLALSSLSMAETIKVAVAANVSYAINDLKKEFNLLYPDTKVQVILGSTGKLTAQIKNGAPYQVLLGANMMYPKSLYEDGFAVTRPLVYAQGSLALITVKKHDLSKGLNILKSQEVKRVALASPKTAPYGMATVEALKKAKLYDMVKEKFVFAESISQTVTYAMKATDLGFIAKSSLYSPQMKHFKKGENWVEVDAKLYTPIDQGVVILKKGEGSSEVAAFYAFLLSKRAKSIFEKFGYIVP